MKEGMFPRTLETLVFRGNRIPALPAGVLDGRLLRNLFLDGNGLQVIEPGAVEATLEHVWMGGNVLNCSSARSVLPRGVKCIDEHCDAKHPIWVGGGRCHRELDPQIDTAQCAWDGGDCETFLAL